MPRPNVSCRFFTSPGLMPEAATRMRTSPGAGSGSGISPTTITSRAGPCFSYQAAFIGHDPLCRGCCLARAALLECPRQLCLLKRLHIHRDEDLVADDDATVRQVAVPVN